MSIILNRANGGDIGLYEVSRRGQGVEVRQASAAKDAGVYTE